MTTFTYIYQLLVISTVAASRLAKLIYIYSNITAIDFFTYYIGTESVCHSNVLNDNGREPNGLSDEMMLNFAL